jgi:hypothetical protein
MKKILCAALIIVMLSSASKTYSQPAKENKNINTRTISIAISPLTILEYEPTINVQLMYRFNNRYSAAIEVGRIIKPLDKNEDPYTSGFSHQYKGWRFRPEFRFWKKASDKNNPENSYFAIQGLIKIAENRLYYDVQRTTPSGLWYTEAVEQNIHKTVLGLSCLAGKEADLFNSKKFYTDIFTGLGLRYKFLKDNLGSDFSKTSDQDFLNQNGIYPTAVLGIRIGFRRN